MQDRNTGDLRNISSNVLDNHSFLSIFIVPSSSGSYYFMLRMLDGKRVITASVFIHPYIIDNSSF